MGGICEDLSRRREGLHRQQRVDPETDRNTCEEMITTDERALARVSVCDMVQRIPRWLRGDLNANDPMLRERAEDALVAMIAALQENGRT